MTGPDQSRAVTGRYYVNAYHNRIEQIRAVNAAGKETDEATEWDTSAYIGRPEDPAPYGGRRVLTQNDEQSMLVNEPKLFVGLFFFFGFF